MCGQVVYELHFNGLAVIVLLGPTIIMRLLARRDSISHQLASRACKDSLLSRLL